MQNSSQQRRAFFRLRFPVAELPTLDSAGQRFVVIELSEGGCRLKPFEQGSLAIGSVAEGEVHFADGKEPRLQGTVVRADRHEVAVRLARGIDLKTMVALQRQLLRKYPVVGQ